MHGGGVLAAYLALRQMSDAESRRDPSWKYPCRPSAVAADQLALTTPPSFNLVLGRRLLKRATLVLGAIIAIVLIGTVVTT
jgi:hypothetical protein